MPQPRSLLASFQPLKNENKFSEISPSEKKQTSLLTIVYTLADEASMDVPQIAAEMAESKDSDR